MKRVGIVGGTFDPIHYGHLMLGRQAFEEYHLDEVWYMPSRQPPHKKSLAVSPAGDRAFMVLLAIEGIPYFSLSEFELKREHGNTYTADTLSLLTKLHPDTDFFFIVGADSVYEIETWYRPDLVLEQATILAAHRDYEDDRLSLEKQIDYLQKKYHARIFKLHCREFDAASAEIRTRIAEDKTIEGLLPPSVEEYIRSRGLYKSALDTKEHENRIAERRGTTL